MPAPSCPSTAGSGVGYHWSRTMASVWQTPLATMRTAVDGLVSGALGPADQQALVDAALATYGSAEEAHRWVLPPETSAHVAGRAVDVGPQDAAAWLADNAATYGLCRTYDNEWWHIEAMPADGVCPAPLPDSSWGW